MNHQRFGFFEEKPEDLWVESNKIDIEIYLNFKVSSLKLVCDSAKGILAKLDSLRNLLVASCVTSDARPDKSKQEATVVQIRLILYILICAHA